MKIENNRIIVDPPKRPKKISGTRFASVLGLNHWNTPFSIWCAVTRTYEEPFVDNIYTRAGKAIEPIIIKYLNKMVFFGDLVSAEQYYGGDPFKKTHGDMWPEVPVFGGLWDGIVRENGKTAGVVEIKTTKRAEDWSGGPPEYYALQGALYAWLLGIDEVHMVCGFLTDKDYEHPDNFKPTSSNTIIESFLISERYPQFQNHIDRVMEWWNNHVLTGISPEFDEKKDAEILRALRTTKITNDVAIEELLREANVLEKVLEETQKQTAPTERRLKEIKDNIKSQMQARLPDMNNAWVEVAYGERIWTLSKGSTDSIDKEKLTKDGLLSKYTISKVSYTLRNKMKEDIING